MSRFTKQLIFILIPIVLLGVLGVIGGGGRGVAMAADCASNADGNWSAAGIWTSCGGGVPGASKDTLDYTFYSI